MNANQRNILKRTLLLVSAVPLSLLLRRKVRDPGLGSVTITDVSVTPDQKIDHVNYSALVGPEERKAVAQALRRSGGFLRRELGRVLDMR